MSEPEKLRVIGHGPVPSHSPYVPDFLVVDGPAGEHVVTREGVHRAHPDSFRKSAPTSECEPVLLRPGMWPLLSGREVVDWMPLADEAAWRAERAKQMLELTRTMAGRPEEILATVVAASKLVGYDVEAASRR